MKKEASFPLPHAAQAGPPRIPSSDSFPEGPAFKSAGPLSDHATVSLLLGGGVCIRLADIRKPTLLDCHKPVSILINLAWIY